MKLAISKDIQCNTYSALIKFSEYGSSVLTPEDEEELLNDYCLKFKLSDITFSGKYKIEDGKAIKDDDGGEDVSLVVPNKSIGINSDLEIGCTVYSADVTNNEFKSTYLNSVDAICKAKIQLFIDKVTEHIGTLITNAEKNFNDNYEKPSIVTVG